MLRRIQDNPKGRAQKNTKLERKLHQKRVTVGYFSLSSQILPWSIEIPFLPVTSSRRKKTLHIQKNLHRFKVPIERIWFLKSYLCLVLSLDIRRLCLSGKLCKVSQGDLQQYGCFTIRSYSASQDHGSFPLTPCQGQ